MSKVEITDELLYECYPKTEEYLLDQLPKDEEIDYVFSEVFEMKMRKLINKSKRPSFLSKMNTYSKRVAIFFIVILSLFTITMSVEALRTQLFDLIKNVYDKFTIYQYKTKDDRDTEEYLLKMPQYIPSGFKEVDKIQENDSMFLSYSNGYDYITFESFKLTDTNIYLDTENSVVTKVMINDIEADYIVKDKDYKIIWQDNDNIHILTLESLDSSKLVNQKNELMKIAESIK